MTQKKFYVCQRMKFCLIGKKIHESCLTGRRIWNALSRIHRIDSKANGANWRKANSLAYYAALRNFGHKDFLALGYKAHVVKEYFLNYRALNADITVDLMTGETIPHHLDEVDWRVTLIDTDFKR